MISQLQIKREITLKCWRRNKICSFHRSCSILSSDFQHHNPISLLQSCHQIPQTSQVHCLILKAGLDRIPFPQSKLLARISMQGIDCADSIFKQIKRQNLYMINTMLGGHSAAADPRNGLLLFNCMTAENLSEDLAFDQFTFISVLKSYSGALEIQAGLGVYSVVLKSGFDLALNVANALLHDAHKLLDEMSLVKDSVSWNTLMGDIFP